MKWVFLVLFTIFITACMPMDLKIQQAIFQTQTAEMTKLPSSTLPPKITITPSPSFTPKLSVTQKSKYFLEIGFCTESREIVGDPKKMGCEAIDIQPIYPTQAGYVSISTKDSIPFLFMYCAIYDENYKLVDAQIEKKGAETLTCSFR